MPSEHLAILRDWDALFSAHSIVLIGEPLSGIFSVFDHIRRKNPEAIVSVLHDLNSIAFIGNTDVIIEIRQSVSGNTVQRLLIIQKWKGHDIPNIAIPFVIKADSIEVDTKERVV